MANELVIMRWENKILSVQIQQGKIQQIHPEETEQAGAVRLGDIYVGKVRNIVKNINAAFVEFSKGQMGYLPLSGENLPVHTQGRTHQEGRVLIGDEIIVQVAREAVKTKPPTLTGSIELTGRYVVLTAGQPKVGISKRIQDKEQRERLSRLLEQHISPEYGWIARTNGSGAPEGHISQEVQALSQQYCHMVSRGMHSVPFTCLYKAPASYLCDIRDGYAGQVERILTDDGMLYQEMKQYLESLWQEGVGMLTFWDAQKGKLDAVYNVSRTLERALMPKVWLKSGAYVVIQPTEALVSIDVNTGKAVSKKKDVQKTYLKVNKEAAWEIAHQLRLRNLSGMILVDFIDMDSQEANLELLDTLRQAVRTDQVQTTVVDMTKLGLVELTRKKLRKPLYEAIHG